MIRNCYVLMTALVPHIGHQRLIEFASQLSSGRTYVIVQGRSFEPVDISIRVNTLVHQFSNYNVSILSDLDDFAPQNPDPVLETEPGADKQFWNYWNDRIKLILKTHGISVQSDDAIVASEPYGAVLAKNLGCKFIPYDIAREIDSVKGENIRKNIKGNWDQIIPEFKKRLQLNFVLFGQESVGKTTLARSAALENQPGQFIPEYARGYLEAVGSEITDQKMDDIVEGQFALQNLAYQNGKLFNFFDTDLLSTIGYYRIFEQRELSNRDEDRLIHHKLYVYLLRGLYKHHYILLPDDIEFVPDELRYGGDVRQSTYQFWKDLLDEYGCKYSEVPKGLDFDEKLGYIRNIVDLQYEQMVNPIRSFRRE